MKNIVQTRIMLAILALLAIASPSFATDGDYSTNIASAFTTYTTNATAWASAVIVFAVVVGGAKLVRRLIKSV